MKTKQPNSNNKKEYLKEFEKRKEFAEVWGLLFDYEDVINGGCLECGKPIVTRIEKSFNTKGEYNEIATILEMCRPHIIKND